MIELSRLAIPQLKDGEFDISPLACVVRGAAWLDERLPGWERKIDLSTLNITDADQCVCGQVVPQELVTLAGSGTGFGVVCDATEAEFGEPGDSIWTWHHGFAGFVHQDHWVALIKERFDSGLLSDVV